MPQLSSCPICGQSLVGSETCPYGCSAAKTLDLLNRLKAHLVVYPNVALPPELRTEILSAPSMSLDEFIASVHARKSKSAMDIIRPEGIMYAAQK